MDMYNSDGSRGKCAAMLSDASVSMSLKKGLPLKQEITVELSAGLKSLNSIS
jgi:hypothetical protein